MFNTRPDSIILASAAEDTPHYRPGSLIPQSVKRSQAIVRHATSHHVIGIGLGAALGVLLLAITVNMMGLQANALRATPVVTIYDPTTNVTTPLPWGSHQVFGQPSFFAETRDSFIAQAMTFIEVNLAAMQLRYFEAGVLRLSMPIVGKGSVGSWWETPAGIYETTGIAEERFSTTAQTIQPWSITFATNYVIHGQPLYPDGTPVPAERIDGGIRLATKDAAALARLVEVGTPVLVHDRPPLVRPLVFDAPLPDMTAGTYLVAERETGTILAGQAATSVVPIASLTKLMTALVVAESLDLESRITIKEADLTSSIIPRLSGRRSVSLYSLLQLLLVESSNEAADLLAAQLPPGNFVAAMNQKAATLGMADTVFADASGLSVGNVSTAHDLFILMQYLAQQRSFILDLTNQAMVKGVYTPGEFGELVNFNKSTSTHSFRGGKVGETLAAGQTSVSLHAFPVGDTTRDVVVVILGSTARSADLKRLLDFTAERLR